MTTASKQIREEMYNRFILAIIRLKHFKKEENKPFEELFKHFFGDPYTKTQLAMLILADDDHLVELTVITALMEASKTWVEFEKLHSKQKDGEGELMKPDNDPKYTDFDKLLVGMLKVPPPVKKSKNSSSKQ